MAESGALEYDLQIHDRERLKMQRRLAKRNPIGIHLIGDFNIDLLESSLDASNVVHTAPERDDEMVGALTAFISALGLRLVLPLISGAHAEDRAAECNYTRWQWNQRPSLLDYALTNSTATCTASWEGAPADHAVLQLKGN